MGGGVVLLSIISLHFSSSFPRPIIANRVDPPIPGKPCRYDAAKVIKGTSNSVFTNITGQAPSEDQLVAFLYHNGVSGGVVSLSSSGEEGGGQLVSLLCCVLLYLAILASSQCTARQHWHQRQRLRTAYQGLRVHLLVLYHPSHV